MRYIERDHIIIALILCAALTATIVSGAFLHDLRDLVLRVGDPSSSMAGDDPTSSFVGRGLNLLHHGTFGDNSTESSVQKGIVIRGPGYAFALAVSFFLFGENIISIIGLNFLFLCLAVLFLWRVSCRFWSGWWAFLPPFMLGVFWGSVSMVWVPNYEMFSLFFINLFLFLFLKYKESQNIKLLIGASIVFSILILERPITLYFFPIAFLIVLCVHWNILRRKTIMLRLIVFLCIVGMIVGLWSLRNHYTMNTYQLGNGGLILLRRASQANFSFDELISMTLSFSAGDYLGSKMYSRFPENAKPKTWDPAIERRLESSGFYRKNWYLKDNDGSMVSRVEFDRRLYEEAFFIIKKYPIKFFLTGLPNFFRLNSPMNYGGQEIMHLFVGTKNYIPAVLKILILLSIRIIWYAFLAILLYGMIKHIKEWQTWGIISMLIIYYNVMYVFLTHSEVRYALMIMPFYFLFFIEGVKLLYEKYPVSKT